MAELEKFIETDADEGTVKLNGKNTFKKNQYVTEGNYAIDLANSDIWKANDIWFADTSNASNEGLMFPRSDGSWDSLSVLDGKIKLTTGITAGLGITTSGGTTQVIADYVVDTGTSDIWTYRKWNSGIAECWMRYQGAVSAYSSGMLSGASYGYYKNWDLPFEFTELYTKTATAQVGNGACFVASGGLNDTLKTVCLHWASNLSSGTSTVNMYIIGKWK